MHLAERHKVSQTSVREALVRLEHAGLVRRIHNVGTFVTQMTAREVQERLRLRVMLEGLAGMEAARLMQPRHLEEMERRLEAIDQAVAEEDHLAAAKADLEFHRLIWACSGDNTLYGVLDGLTVPLLVFVSLERRRVHQPITRERFVRVHEPIADALRRHDPAAAQEALRAHLETSYAEYRGSVQAYTLAVGSEGNRKDFVE
jgi:DNA-binding GntR family transcriptional regulator